MDRGIYGVASVACFGSRNRLSRDLECREWQTGGARWVSERVEGISPSFRLFDVVVAVVGVAID